MLLAAIGAGSQGHPRPWLLGGHSCGVAWGACSTKGRGSSVQGLYRSGQNPAMTGLSWFWLVLTNSVSGTPPGNPVSLVTSVSPASSSAAYRFPWVSGFIL